MRFLPSIVLLYGSLAWIPFSTSTPFDSIDASTLETFGNGFCVDTFGPQSFVGLYTNPEGHGICQCYNPKDTSIPLSAYSECNGGVLASCSNEIDYVGGQDYHLDQCGYCIPPACDDYSFLDRAYETACGVEGQNLYVVNNEFCACGTPESLGGPLGTNLLARCTTTIPNAYAVCYDGTIVTGNPASTSQSGSCTFECNPGFSVSTDGTSCVMGASQLPRAKAKFKAKRWSAEKNVRNRVF